ncbi:hypothetical protein Y032_0866g2765 [Ancylostoma ceylanicum]|nr:hypothetical protein Y032_0866g2765 [Ancylostoma ceylanicum]
MEREVCTGNSTATSSSSVEVKCDKKANGTTNAGLLEDLKAEFDSLSTLTNFNRTGADVKAVFASKEKIVCEMVVGPGHVNAKVGVLEIAHKFHQTYSARAMTGT